MTDKQFDVVALNALLEHSQFYLTLDKIDVPPDRIRERGNLKIDKMKLSLSSPVGQILPIIVTRGENSRYTLIDGERRFLAAQALGWNAIRVIDKSDASEDEIRILEILANEERENFLWTEQIRARAELHERMCRLYGASTKSQRIKDGWTIAHTAKMLDVNKSTVHRDLELAKVIDRRPELADSPSKKAVLMRVRREIDFAVREAIAKLSNAQEASRAYTLHIGDAVDTLRTFADNSIDCVVTDPPFGLDIGNMPTWSTSWSPVGLVYADTEELYQLLLSALIPELYRVLKPGRHAYVFYGIHHHAFVADAFLRAGFILPCGPLFWPYTLTKCVHMDRYTLDYYVARFACKPDMYNRWQELDGFHTATIRNVPAIPGAQRRHPAEAPYQLFERFVLASSRKGEIILDPFAGSGSVGEACIRNSRVFIGIDESRDWINLTQLRLEQVERELVAFPSLEVKHVDDSDLAVDDDTIDDDEAE
jgi:site-specific DNA-methyltransferase (adenine-specific)